MKRLVGPLADRARFVAGQDLSLPLLEHRDQRVDARAEAGDLAGVEPDRAGQLLLGELAALAEHEHVLERRRDQIGRRLRRAGKPRRVVPLVRVDDAAERVAIGHGRVESGGSRVEGQRNSIVQTLAKLYAAEQFKNRPMIPVSRRALAADGSRQRRAFARAFRRRFYSRRIHRWWGHGRPRDRDQDASPGTGTPPAV